MREMKEETYNAIKNRTMAGANGFSYNLSVEGYTGGYTDIGSSVSRSYAGASWFDFEVLDNNKVLAIYKSGNNIYAKTVIDLDTLLSTDALTGGTLIYTLAGFKTESCFAVKKLKDGTVLLNIADLGLFGEVPQTFKIYRLADITRHSFDLISTIKTYGRLVENSNYDQNYTSKIAEQDDGSLLVAGPEYSSYAGQDISFLTIYKSADKGVTWTKKFQQSHRYYPFSGRLLSDMVYVDESFVFFTHHVTSTGYEGVLMYSLNGGETWTSILSAFETWPSYAKMYKHTIMAYNKTENRLYAAMQDMTTLRRFNMYRSEVLPEVVTSDWIRNFLNWTEIATDLLTGDFSARTHALESGEILLSGAHTGPTSVITGFHREVLAGSFDASSISITKSHGGASSAFIKMNNKDGVVNPRNVNGPLYGIMNLNKKVVIKQGYGTDLVHSFSGIIDGIHMSTFPQVAEIKLRDDLKKALDQTVTKGGRQVVKYARQPIENIVADLCGLCGLPIGKIDPTGISIEKEFNWQTYADAFSFLSDIASFEYLVDESGQFHFRRDYQPADMEVAWSFEEGVDIQDLSYEINDADLYRAVRVYGRSEDDDVLVYNAAFAEAQEFNILPQKIMKIDATEASTMGELAKIAQRALAIMRSRTRVVQFSAIAIPHLQVGDFIQLFETSTNTHEIYRLTAINLSMTKDSFTMTCTAYYYGDSLVPDELPPDIAYQIPDPALNLIPNMTSNTKPSGVARSSSVYKQYNITYSPWMAFNDHSNDYFWDLSTKAGWIEYEFPLKHIVDKYMIKARQLILYNKALPKDWTFEAFDGSKWIVLDTRKNQTDWQIYEKRTFKFANTTPYAKYRLRVTDNNGYVRSQIEQLAMYYGGGA